MTTPVTIQMTVPLIALNELSVGMDVLAYIRQL
jgi:hypothetical protein